MPCAKATGFDILFLWVHIVAQFKLNNFLLIIYVFFIINSQMHFIYFNLHLIIQNKNKNII